MYAFVFGSVDFWLVFSPYIASYTGWAVSAKDNVDHRFFMGFRATKWFFISYIAINTLACFVLICKMFKLHRYEFKRNILQFIVYNFLLQLFFSLNIWKLGQDETLQLDASYLQYAHTKCDKGKLASALVTAISVVPALICFFILKLKKDDDMLNSISKLDWLLKISRF